jgi:hypothetical protein
MQLHSLPAALIALFVTITCATPLPQPQGPPGGDLQDSTGQVAIHGGADANTTTSVPITATIFAGVQGRKNCRGGVMTRLELPPPEGLGMRTVPQCYNLPQPSGCGNFVANKNDGCEAKLYSDLSCVTYMNTAVFSPDDTPTGGLWRSMLVQCGIPPIDPASLGPPPLAGMIQNAKKTPKVKGH